MGLGCGASLIKYVLFTFNLVCAVSRKLLTKNKRVAASLACMCRTFARRKNCVENSSAVTIKKNDEKLLLAADTFAELCVMSSVRCFG